MCTDSAQVVFWLKALALTSHDVPSEPLKRNNDFLTERTLQLGVSFVCLMPGLSNPATRSLFHSCVSSLLNGVKLAVPAKLTSAIELSVWIAVQLLLGNLSNIAAVVLFVAYPFYSDECVVNCPTPSFPRWSLALQYLYLDFVLGQLVREALGMHLTVHKAMMRDLVDAATTAGILSEPSSVAAAVAALRSKGPITLRRYAYDSCSTCRELCNSEFSQIQEVTDLFLYGRLHYAEGGRT